MHMVAWSMSGKSSKPSTLDQMKKERDGQREAARRPANRTDGGVCMAPTSKSGVLVDAAHNASVLRDGDAARTCQECLQSVVSAKRLISISNR